MASLRYFLLLLLASSISAKSFFNSNSAGPRLDPFVPADLPVNHTVYRNIGSITLDTNIDVYAPNATGNFPVFYFIPGFGGTVPAEAHSFLLTHIASHGFVVVAAWKIGGPASSFDPTWLESTVNFVETRLERDLRNNQGYDSGFRVDYLRSFIGAHSAGSHVAVIELQQSCANYQGLILIDAVDGNNPIPENITLSVITPGQKVNFTVPVLEIVTGFDPVPDIYGIPCAPEPLSGKRFFDAMTGPTWYVNATAYGHLDLCDPGYLITINDITKLCPTDPDSPKDDYIQFLAGETVAFMYGVLEPVNNCDLFLYLEQSGLNGINTLNEFAANGWERCTPLQCTQTPSNDPFHWFW